MNLEAGQMLKVRNVTQQDMNKGTFNVLDLVHCTGRTSGGRFLTQTEVKVACLITEHYINVI
jgi:kynureninase